MRLSVAHLHVVIPAVRRRTLEVVLPVSFAMRCDKASQTSVGMPISSQVTMAAVRAPSLSTRARAEMGS